MCSSPRTHPYGSRERCKTTSIIATKRGTVIHRTYLVGFSRHGRDFAGSGSGPCPSGNMMRGTDVVSLLLGFVCRSTLQPALSFRVHPSNRWSSPSRALRPPQQRRRLHFLDTHAAQPPTRDCTTTALAARGSPGFLSDEAVSCFRNLGTGSTVYLVGVVHNAKRSSQVNGFVSIHGTPSVQKLILHHTTHVFCCISE